MARRKPARKSTAGKVSVVQTADGGWELVHPRCALARREDIEEVEEMIAAGENEIATDELRWLLSECHDFLAAHQLLGDLALAGGDVKLARGHYGYAYQLGVKAIEQAAAIKLLPFARPANQAFFRAGRGVAMCLMQMGKRGLAKEVIDRLLQLDLGDPLRLRELRNAPRGGCGK
jgi:tetratricopeptide (TPR) repeat protein